jgi:hypothetical protein
MAHAVVDVRVLVREPKKGVKEGSQYQDAIVNAGKQSHVGKPVGALYLRNPTLAIFALSIADQDRRVRKQACDQKSTHSRQSRLPLFGFRLTRCPLRLNAS